MNEARRLIVDFTEKQHGVVNRRQLLDGGLTSRAVRHQVDSGFIEALSPQVLKLAGSPVTEAQRAMSGVLDAPSSAFLSHRSAAAWWGLPGFKMKHPIHVVIPWQGTTRRTRLAEVHYHRALPAEHLTSLGGIPVVSPALLMFLLAGSENRGRTERALDNGLSMRLLTTRTLSQLARSIARQRSERDHRCPAACGRSAAGLRRPPKWARVSGRAPSARC